MVRGLTAAATSLVLLACGSGAPAAEAPDDGLFLPESSGPVPVVVLVPGGGWTSADPTGLVPLARALAEGGVVAATTTYRTASDGAVFPTPVEDVLCAATEVVARAADHGRVGGPLVLVGHSAGAQLAVVAALRGDDLGGRCSVETDAVVGLAGAYDVTALPDLAIALFGVPQEDDPALWATGDPLRAASERPELPVLLVHGDADGVVPPSMTQALARALRHGGHVVDVVALPSEDHMSVFTPQVVAPTLLTWLAALPARAAQPTATSSSG